MGKAVRSPRPKSATAKDPNRVSIEAAGDALRRVFGNSHVSRECLDKAIRERRVRLWCDDYLLSPEYFARELRVALESDERFTIGSIRAMERSNYVWMVSREDLTKLTERERLDDVHENLSTNPVGRPKDYKYDQICGVGKELLAIGVDDTQAGFFERVRNACVERGIVTPGESRGMGRIVGELYRLQRPPFAISDGGCSDK
jgi:hypothetical protein